jgi:uncharacterized protein YkwD
VPELPPCYRDQAHLDAMKAGLNGLSSALDQKNEPSIRYAAAVARISESSDAEAARAAREEQASPEYAALERDRDAVMAKLNAYFDALYALKPCPPEGNTQPPPNSKPVSFEDGDGNISLPEFAEEILDAHNEARAEVGAPPLMWSIELALSAGEWARHLAEIGRLEHAPREGRGIERENLAQVPIGWSVDQAIDQWLGEKSDFMPGVFPDVSRTWESDNVLHYTQMIWPQTTDIGCYVFEDEMWKWVVCRYSPGGNRPGEWVGLRPVPAIPPPPSPPPPPP